MDIEKLLKLDVSNADKFSVDIMRQAVHYAAKALGYNLGIWTTNSRHRKNQWLKTPANKRGNVDRLITTYAVYKGDRPWKLWKHIDNNELLSGVDQQIIVLATFKNLPNYGKTSASAEYKALEQIYNVLENEL